MPPAGVWTLPLSLAWVLDEHPALTTPPPPQPEARGWQEAYNS